MDTDEVKQARFDAERDRILRQFGETLRELRGPRTQEAIADLTNLHPTYIGLVERGRREPKLSVLLILADAFGVPLDRLARGLPVPAERKPSKPPAGR